jgi:hypothetical protein
LCNQLKRHETGIKLLIILKVLLKVSVKKTRNPAQIFRFSGREKIQKDNQALGFEGRQVAAKGLSVKYLSVVSSRRCGV